MKEYTILLRRGQARPYTIGTYKNIETAKLKINDIVDLEEKRARPFYVDNDYFINTYNFDTNIFYICLLEREVSNYTKYAINTQTQIFLNII